MQQYINTALMGFLLLQDFLLLLPLMDQEGEGGREGERENGFCSVFVFSSNFFILIFSHLFFFFFNKVNKVVQESKPCCDGVGFFFFFFLRREKSVGVSF
jgi:hypothetical protein